MSLRLVPPSRPLFQTGTNSTGDGSQGKPWASLSYACSKAKLFGDTIVINPGAYTDSAQCILYPGVNISGAGKDRTAIKSNYSDWYIRYDIYYTLSPGSPLIDAGTNVGLPFQGSAPDIGAFEFGNTIGPPSNLRVVP